MATSVGSLPNTQADMPTPTASLPFWEQIERSESYLICSMFEEAASLASCVLKRLCNNTSTEGAIEDAELNDMRESAGMVFVQSLKELGRTLEIINELMQLYGSLTAIPVQVFLIGVCFQMQEDPHGVNKILEEFLSKWIFVDERYYVLASQKTDMTAVKEYSIRFVLEADTYLQVVEVYVALLVGILKNADLAISWVEKAALSEQTRQEVLRRVQSMYSSKVTSSQDESANSSVSLKNGTLLEGTSKMLETGRQADGGDAAKQAILSYSGQRVPTLWWFRTFNLKFGSVRFAVSNGSLLLAALMLLAYYFMRRKKYTITRILKGQYVFVKKGVIELWQLAFSYQVNPLAAMEPLAAHGGR